MLLFQEIKQQVTWPKSAHKKKRTPR